MPKDKELPITVQGMFGQATNQPLVMFRMGEQFVNMEPAKAREIALMLLECAESAEQDAGLIDFLRGHGFGDAQIAVFVKSVRDRRQAT